MSAHHPGCQYCGHPFAYRESAAALTFRCTKCYRVYTTQTFQTIAALRALQERGA